MTLVPDAGISSRDKEIHTTVICEMQLLIPAWNTCVWHQSSQVLVGAVYICYQQFGCCFIVSLFFLFHFIGPGIFVIVFGETADLLNRFTFLYFCSFGSLKKIIGLQNYMFATTRPLGQYIESLLWVKIGPIIFVISCYRGSWYDCTGLYRDIMSLTAQTNVLLTFPQPL